ncbi:MAG: S8 family serine peptidase [Phycisphaerales bacterium]|nr:S8 family serine peptidase [Phycisphaerales bacterium]
MGRSFRLPFVAGMSVASFAFVVAAAPMARPIDEIATIRYFKDAESHAVDLSRVGLIARDRAAEDAMDRQLDALGIDRGAARPLAHGNIWTVDVPGRLRSADGVRTVLDGLLAAPELAFVTPLLLDDRGGDMIPLPSVFVGFEADVAPGEAMTIVADSGIGAIVQFDRYPGNVHLVAPTIRDGAELLDAVNVLALHPRVAFAETDRVMRAYETFVPNDPLFGNQWQLNNPGGGNGFVFDIDLNGPEAWDLEDGSASVIVAVLDSGIQQNHPDIHQLTPGSDMTDLAFLGFNGGPIFDLDNHGTAVAGLISAFYNNSLGVAGVAPNCRTVSIKIAYDDSPADGWTSQSSWIADGVYEAQDRGCRITNSSFYVGSSATVTLAYTITSATMLHFGSAGNGGDDDIGDPALVYPASLPAVQAVAALDPDGTLTSFSNWGTGLQFAAPGNGCWTTDRTGSAGYAGGDYTSFGGTSAASPLAAGVAALVWSTNLGLTPGAVLSYMQQTTKDLGVGGYDTIYGYGLPRASGAVVLALFEDDCPGSGSCYDGNGSPGCSNGSCCFLVCSEDPFCCNSSWDGICAGEALDLCSTCGDANAGSCYQSNGSPSCNNAECCAAVCEVDAFCCDSSWDGICAGEADDLCAPENDECGSAIALTTGVPYAFSTLNATSSGPDHALCEFFGNDSINNDIWFKWTATCGGYVTVSTCNTADFDTKMALYKPGLLGGSCPSGTPLFSAVLLACNDDDADCGLTSKIVYPVVQGTTYKIRLGGYNNSIGTGTILVTCGIPNDTCTTALEIFDGQTPFSTVGAATDGPANANCDFFGNDQVSQDIWFRYVATCTGPLSISTCGAADFDTKLAVYGPGILGGTCPGGLFGGVLLGCVDDTAGCEGNTSTLAVTVEEGTTYRIRVGGYGSASGHGTLTVACGAACEGDLNGDGAVDGADLGALLGQWGGPGSADLDGNGTVDGADLGLLLGNWGGC